MQVITDAIITVEGLYKEFGHGKVHALNGVDAQVRKGEVLVVIGPSGSGKSTFLRCLNLLELPTKGKITFEGVDITDSKVNINIHRQKMGMVFQHFNLFPNMTVLKNLSLIHIWRAGTHSGSRCGSIGGCPPRPSSGCARG